jgi:MoaA/NifB/PqqE/SkfB family radical SAM enzyme
MELMKINNSLELRTRKQYDLDKSLLKIDPAFPKEIMIELSNACNHKCIFCTSPYMTRKIGRLDNHKLIKILEESFEYGARHLGFYTTGEPFVYKGIETIVKKSKEIGYEYVYISTNGALAIPDKSKKVIDAGIDSIKFSINAFNREDYKLIHGKDEWDLVLENLKFISKYRKKEKKKFRLYITSIITKVTEKNIEPFKKKFLKLVDEIQFSAVHAQSGYMIKAHEILKVSKEEGLNSISSENNSDICMIPFNRLHVTCEGFLTACCVDYQNYLTVADLNLVSIRDAWFSKPFRNLRKMHIEKKLDNTLCDNCWNRKCENVKPIISKFATKLNMKTHSDFVEEEINKKLVKKN